MDAAPPSTAVAPASPAPAPAPPDVPRWVPPVADVSVRLPEPPPPTWPRSAQATAALLLFLTVALLAWHALSAQGWNCRPSVIESGSDNQTYVDLNRADRAQLLQLPGVGEGLADRIVAYRAEHRGFRDVEELRRVGGVGPKLMEKLRPFVRVEREETDDEEAPGAPAPPPAGKKPGPRPIDVNRATAKELRRLPGIGPKLSQRILDVRAAKPFRSVDDLRRVPGIGPKTLERLRPHVVVR